MENMKSVLKEAFGFFAEIFKAPIVSLKIRHDLTWTKIASYVAVLVLTYNIVAVGLESLSAAVLGSILFIAVIQIAYLSACLAGSTWILRKFLLISIEYREAAQVWLKAIFFAMLANLLVSMVFRSVFGYGVLVVGVTTALIIGFSMLTYLKTNPSFDLKKSYKIVGAVAVTLMILPVLSFLSLRAVNGIMMRQAWKEADEEQVDLETSNDENSAGLAKEIKNEEKQLEQYKIAMEREEKKVKYMQDVAGVDPIKHQSLQQYFNYYEAFGSDLEPEQIAKIEDAAIACSIAVFGRQQSDSIDKNVRQLVFHSPEQIEKWEKYNEYFKGKPVTPIPTSLAEQKKLCMRW